MKEHILIVDDDQDQCDLLATLVSRLDYRVTSTTSPTDALALAASGPFDAILTDLGMSTMSGTELCSRIMASRADVPVIVVTGLGSMERAVASMRAGAYDFLNKPVDVNVLGITLQRAVQHRRLREEIKRLREQVPDAQITGSMIGDSPPMKRVIDLIGRVGPTEASVLICGETGTGKELVAHAIHQRSSRAEKPFVAVNCAAIPKDLVESELFGHVRGAFTGAQSARAGLFEAANTGTIFLDEVGDLPLSAQVKLLRTLQEAEIKRVGADDTKIVDVRVLAATNVDLKSRIAAGTFRSDLYYRLNVIAIDLPALRDRGDDVALLADHFVLKYSRRMGREPRRMSASTLQALRSYAWPGNVRELEHAIERAVVLAQGDVIHPSDLPFDTCVESNPPPSEASAGPRLISGVIAFANLPYAEARRRALAEAVLLRAEGNLSEAARQAGIDRSNFKRLVRRGKP